MARYSEECPFFNEHKPCKLSVKGIMECSICIKVKLNPDDPLGITSPHGGIGRRVGLKIRSQGGGSSPSAGTTSRRGHEDR